MLAYYSIVVSLTSIDRARAAPANVLHTTRLVVSSVENLTGDPLIAPAAVDSLLTRLFSLTSFEYQVSSGGGQQLESEFTAVPNPFRIDQTAPADTNAVVLQLELEESYYGPVVDPKEAIVSYWAFGLLSTLSFHESVMGCVQWRATLRDRSAHRSVVLGRAVCVGDPRTLGRREAISRANKRALYDLGHILAEAVASECEVRLQRTYPHENVRLFQEKAENW